MTLSELLRALDRAGVRLSRDGDNLRVRGKKNTLPPEAIDAAKAHKPALLALLDGEGVAPSRLLSSDKSLPHCTESPTLASRLIVDAAGLDTLTKIISQSERVAVDLETTGLDTRRDRVRLIQLATERGVYIVDCFRIDPATLWPALAGKELVFHNAAFDAAFLALMGLDISACSIRDTMILSALLTAGDFSQRNTLEAVAERYLGIALDKSPQKADWSGELTPDMLDYGAKDALATRDVYPLLLRDIDAAGLRAVADLEERCLPAVLWLSGAGVAFDREAWLHLASNAEQEAETLGKQLAKLAPPKRDGSPWNFNSPKQVTEMFTLLGIELESTGEDALAAIEHPMADTLCRYRAAAKLAGTYGRAWLDFIGDDGRIRCSWKQTGAKTGRMASGKPNLQNLPKDAAYRRCFLAPPCRVLIRADYSQIELRIAAKVAGEQNMIDAFVRGEDLHALTAQQLTGHKDVTPQERGAGATVGTAGRLSPCRPGSRRSR
jgi:DNA polymerase-1